MTASSAKVVICVERSSASKGKPGTQGSIFEHDGKILTYNCQHRFVEVRESGQPFWGALHLVQRSDCGGCPGRLQGVNVLNGSWKKKQTAFSQIKMKSRRSG